MKENKNCQIYEGAKTIRSVWEEDVIIGESSFIQDSTLGKGVQINRRNMIIDSCIGSYTYTGANTVIKKAKIGKYCSISWNVSITGNQHEYHNISTHPFPRLSSFGFVEKKEGRGLDSEEVTIGNDVWIGMNACILPGVKVSSGSIIGAGGMVTKDVPPYAIVAGNPARILKYRFSEDIIRQLMEIQWWDWPPEVIRKNLFLFQKIFDDDALEKLRIVQSEREGIIK